MSFLDLLLAFCLFSVTFAVAYRLRHRVHVSRKDYRLGDAVKNRALIAGTTAVMINTDCNSLAGQYLNSTPFNGDLPVLEKLVHERMAKRGLTGYGDKLVVHLRLGDLVDKLCASGKQCAEGRSSKRYWGRSIVGTPEIVKVLQRTGLKEVVLIGGAHRSKGLRKSDEYVKTLKDELLRQGFNVEVRINGDPDDDFCIMSSSKYFMRNVGGFSTLISDMVRRQNNVVFVGKD